MKTYNDIYLHIRKILQQAGIEDYSLEAKLLLSSACEKNLSELVRDFQLYTTDSVAQKAEDYVWRRLSGEPVAYITESWEFYGLPLYINSNVLIPRPETELLVETVKEILPATNSDTARILDLCCGSGCITCALANELPSARFLDIDISGNALEVARKNIARHGFNSRAICMQADALSSPPIGVGMFDIIVSNPPYVPSAEIDQLAPTVKDFEPILALDGGADGLKFYKSIIKYWKSQIKQAGFIVFELGENESEPVQDMLLSAGFRNTFSKKDSADIERVVIGQI